MFPIGGKSPFLARFREEFEKHQEFMLAPVVRRADGQQYFNAEYGIIKTTLHFTRFSDLVDMGLSGRDGPLVK